MSGDAWVIADPHFGHRNILRFNRPDGSPLRPFKTVEDMDETIISNWNDHVGVSDRVYLLGDVCFHNRDLGRTVGRLKGRICLVKGNHDTLKLSQYAQYFDDIRACVAKKGYILTHIPIHPGSLSRWSVNIHGHTHCNRVWRDDTGGVEPKAVAGILDTRYHCVSVEQTNYKPVHLQTLLKELGVAGK